MRSTALSGLLLAGLAACQPVVPPVASPGLPGLTLVPASGGLLVNGSGGREIGFGRDQPGALQTVARIEGMAPRGTSCGSGRQAFVTKGNLQLVFESGTFVGWTSGSDTAGRTCG